MCQICGNSSSKTKLGKHQSHYQLQSHKSFVCWAFNLWQRAALFSVLVLSFPRSTYWFLPANVFGVSQTLFLPWWWWARLCWRNQLQTSFRSAGCPGWCTAGCPGTAGTWRICSGCSRSGEPSPAASRSDSDCFSSGKGGGRGHDRQSSHTAFIL